MSQVEHNHHEYHNQGEASRVAIPANAGLHTVKEVKFNFRKDDLGNKRPSVTLQVNVLTLQGLVAILEGGNEKQINLVLETLQTPIIDQVRTQVEENEAITQETLDVSKLSWEAISKLEPATRRGGGIPKETWEAFIVDYIEVMPAVTGKTKEQITRAATLLSNKFSAVKGAKPILQFLRTQLDLYLSSTSKAEEFAACYEFLAKKADDLLQASDETLLANL